MRRWGRNLMAAMLCTVGATALMSGCGKQEEPQKQEAAVSGEKQVETQEEKQQTTVETKQKDKIKVTVGDFLGETFLYPVKIANELGFFEEEFAEDNIEISVEYLGSGAVMVEALTAGDLDMSFLGGQPTFSGIANGNQTKVISMATVSTNDPVLLVAANSEIMDVSQLKGKNMAVNIGTDNHYQMLEMLALGNLTEEDVNVYNLKGTEALSALVSGEIDCMQSIAPNTNKFVKSGDARVLCNLEETGARNNQTLVATEQFIAEHGDIIVRFLKVLDRANEYYKEHTAECFDLLARYCEADRDLMEDYMDNYDCTLRLNQQDKEYMKKEYEFMVKAGILETEIDLDQIYDDSFLMEAFGSTDPK